jgi:hypothetical protein
MTFTATLPTEPGLYRHRWNSPLGELKEQTLFVGYTNARMQKMQGFEPNPYMPRKLKCCPPDAYLHADRLTPAEWGGWWEPLTYNAELRGVP